MAVDQRGGAGGLPRDDHWRTAEAEGKYKKQSGGHGQFGVAELRIEPLERGGGFEFVDKIVGGAIPRQFIPAVEKGIEEAMAEGGVFGYPVVDVRVYCVDGKYHPVDSSEMSFKMAGRLGFREALAQADPVILEPISLLEVTVPTELQGDVMGDLNARRARVQGTEAADVGEQVIVRPGAHRRAAALRRRPAIPHQRPRPVPRPPRPLRRAAQPAGRFGRRHRRPRRVTPRPAGRPRGTPA